MTVSYMGLIPGNHNPVTIAREIKRLYGGTDFTVRLVEFDDGYYTLVFNEKLSEAQQARVNAGEKLFKVQRESVQRQMSIFTDGSCKCDYENVVGSDAPATMLSIGRHGDCEQIILPLVKLFGGWVKDEAKGDEWVRVG